MITPPLVALGVSVVPEQDAQARHVEVLELVQRKHGRSIDPVERDSASESALGQENDFIPELTPEGSRGRRCEART